MQLFTKNYAFTYLTLLFVLALKQSITTTATAVDQKYVENLLKNMNRTVDPCEDFYTYACGNWSQQYASKEYLDMPGYMDYKVNAQILDVLQQQQNTSGIYGKVWRLYSACEQLTAPALNHYLKLVEPELQLQWPVFRANWSQPWANESDFDWLRTIARLRVYGLNGVFITQHINMRLTNGSHFLMEIHQHQPRLKLQQQEVAAIFRNFGLSEEQIANITKQIIAFEKQMKNLTLVDFEIGHEHDDNYYSNKFQEFTVQQLLEKVPDIDWLAYFNIVLGRAVQPEQEVLQVFALKLQYFDELLQTLNSTSNEIICYYIMLKFMYQLNEQIPIRENTMRCVKHVRGFMPLAVNFLYEEHIYKSKRAKTDSALMSIYHRLRHNFERLVQQENALKLNSSERAYILAELRTMRIKIGNVPTELSQQFVEQYYENISIRADNFYANHLQLLRFNTRLQQAQLRNQPIDASKQFYAHDPETASSSSPLKIFDNAILVPYGYLQLPFFEPELSLLLQYSLFGFILAHEIVHAYDLFHIVYDQHGSYSDLGLAVSQHFLDYINCSAQQPSDSLSENMADVSGLRLVYRTYFDDVVQQVDALQQPAFPEFNARQLFFINSVQFLCANIVEISAMDEETYDLEHDMHDVRVRQNWANYEQFAEAFNCEPGAIMHPERKCRLW